jgi:CRP/FNR family cyclic AMP-dependent transcriptional regulator
MLKQKKSFLDIFHEISPKEFEIIKPYFNQRCYLSDEVIFKQQQVADYLYILMEGGVEIRYKPYDAPPLVVANISPGGVFGWSAALGRNFYTSAAISTLECNTYCISHQNLQKLCKLNPFIGDILLDRLACLIAARLRSTHPQVISILRERNGL